jgi:hypothetical protein
MTRNCDWFEKRINSDWKPCAALQLFQPYENKALSKRCELGNAFLTLCGFARKYSEDLSGMLSNNSMRPELFWVLGREVWKGRCSRPGVLRLYWRLDLLSSARSSVGFVWFAQRIPSQYLAVQVVPPGRSRGLVDGASNEVLSNVGSRTRHSPGGRHGTAMHSAFVFKWPTKLNGQQSLLWDLRQSFLSKAWYSGDKWILLRRSQSFPRSGEACKVL